MVATSAQAPTTQGQPVTLEEVERVRSLRRESYAVGATEIVVGAVLKGAAIFEYNQKGTETSSVTSQMALQVNGGSVTANGITYALVSGPGSNQATLNITCANGQQAQVPFNLGALAPQTVNACGQTITFDPTKYYSTTEILNGKLTNVVTQAIVTHPEWTKEVLPFVAIAIAAGIATILITYFRGNNAEEELLRKGVQQPVPPSGATSMPAESGAPGPVATSAPVSAQASAPAPAAASSTTQSPAATATASSQARRRRRSASRKQPIEVHVHINAKDPSTVGVDHVHVGSEQGSK